MKNFFVQLWGELLKLTARKRSHIGFLAFLALEIILFFVFRGEGWQRLFARNLNSMMMGGLFDEYFSALSLAFIVVHASILLLGGIYIALVAGDIVAKEVEDGTLRMILSRPVSRLRLVVVKLVAASIYTYVLILFIGVTCYLLGCLLFKPTGGLFAFIPELKIQQLFSFEEGLIRYAAGISLLGISMLTITTIAFMVSCMKVKPAAAAIVALTILLGDFILFHLPAFEEHRWLLIATRANAWHNVFMDPIPWWDTLRDYAILFGINATAFVIGWISFQSRDFKS